ncbi:hypothetical protein NO559_07925 [Dasania sp. GY-MA-18]|uniref:Uncharacterized protein n=1 Tax=Dasania phycosphaerae TaxID=2950436 RepID=A0A9J6RL23_9GAMM|nr:MULTISPECIES: hypothetical protein [Dasania]MCR8922694.1 hypothetical protein [Dasania sp. GY-MA-18]MCZ0865124.1 hypothetical protein [Dasania phycosphaerae]MCZ0868850.1 hypothetical protein [Dasania phycosphaerae]
MAWAANYSHYLADRRPYWLKDLDPFPRLEQHPPYNPHEAQKGERVVLSDLPIHKRQAYWAAIQKNNPPLAGLLQNDPFFAELKAMGGKISVLKQDIGQVDGEH